MKKLFFLPVVLVFLMSSFTTNFNTPEEIMVNDCASEAWDGADEVCADVGGCSDFESWLITDILYELCEDAQQ